MLNIDMNILTYSNFIIDASFIHHRNHYLKIMVIGQSNYVKIQKKSRGFKWAYALFGKDFRIDTLYTIHCNGIIMPSLKMIGQF